MFPFYVLILCSHFCVYFGRPDEHSPAITRTLVLQLRQPAHMLVSRPTGYTDSRIPAWIDSFVRFTPRLGPRRLADPDSHQQARRTAGRRRRLGKWHGLAGQRQLRTSIHRPSTWWQAGSLLRPSACICRVFVFLCSVFLYFVRVCRKKGSCSFQGSAQAEEANIRFVLAAAVLAAAALAAAVLAVPAVLAAAGCPCRGYAVRPSDCLADCSVQRRCRKPRATASEGARGGGGMHTAWTWVAVGRRWPMDGCEAVTGHGWMDFATAGMAGWMAGWLAGWLVGCVDDWRPSLVCDSGAEPVDQSAARPAARRAWRSRGLWGISPHSSPAIAPLLLAATWPPRGQAEAC